MYPTLPGVNAMAEGVSGFGAGAPPTGLGSSFDPDMRRRYSGGQLQKGAPGNSMDIDDTLVQSPRDSHDSPMPKIDKLGVNSPLMRNSNLDPALRSPGANSEGSSDYADKVQEAWIENVRTIELLRNFVKEKLERGDFVHDSDNEDVPKTKMEEDEAASLYPVLKEVEGH
jgi:hypothetical protein